MTLESVKAPTKSTAFRTQRRPWQVRLGWAAAILLALGAGYYFAIQFWPGTPMLAPIPDADLPMVRQLRIAEKWRLYENVDDLDFVKKLNHPDLFGEDPS
jgi:hypothetical protein